MGNKICVIIWILCVEILYCLAKDLIPKILHRTFVYSDSVDKSAQCKKCDKSFVEHNHDFEIKLWFKKDIINLMNTKELKLYNSLEHDIQRADLARYLILYHHGGYYSDLDVYTFDSWTKMINTFANISSKTENLCVLLEEWHHSNYQLSEWQNSTFRQTYFPMKYRRPTQIQLTNYWMASTKHHPFFKLILDLFEERADIPVDISDNQQILWTSGPGMISQAYYDIYLQKKNTFDNEINAVITIPRYEWSGTGCSVVYHAFHLTDYYPGCTYLHHLGHGHWKTENWCEIDYGRCVLHYGGLAGFIIGAVLIYWYKCVRKKHHAR